MIIDSCMYLTDTTYEKLRLSTYQLYKVLLALKSWVFMVKLSKGG